MWDEFSGLICDAISDATARNLLYQAKVNLELFKAAVEGLDKAMFDLNFADFARSQTCHMSDGIFGEAKYVAQMEAAKTRVVGLLLAAVTSGHRVVRSLTNARNRDKGRDWKPLRDALESSERDYYQVRNFMEHLDEKLYSGKVSGDQDCSFSRWGVLRFHDDKGLERTFDFSKACLSKIIDMFEQVVIMLKARKIEHRVLE